MERRRFLLSVVGVSLAVAACGDAVDGASPDDNDQAVNQVDVSEFHPGGWPGASKDFADDLHDPVDAGEDLPEGFRQVLGRDWINPVYTPTFTDADQVGWSGSPSCSGLGRGQQRSRVRPGRRCSPARSTIVWSIYSAGPGVR